ncbi:hypothetical protein L7F22_028733 [Adiantum nelumboides]|nr:hypothetical protein [Adiantum nelumboides]
MSAVLAKPQVKDFLKIFAKGKEKGQEQRKEHNVNAHAVTEEGEPSKKPWEEDIPELSSPSYSPPTSFSYSSDSSSSSNPRRRSVLASTEKSESAKRFFLQSSLVSPSKRKKLECDSDVLTQSLTPCKLKRQVFAEEPSLCSRNKRMRHEKNPGRWDGDSEHREGEAVCGSKRKKPSDDVCTERSLWKRLKEVKV